MSRRGQVGRRLHISKQGFSGQSSHRAGRGKLADAVELCWRWLSGCTVRCSQGNTGPFNNELTAAAAGTSTAATAAALAGLVAIPAEDRTITARFKGHSCRLSATRTNHRCSLCRSRTVAGAPLVVLLCHTAILATLWGRVTTFLKERLISSGEGEVLPAIAARKLNISGHGSPRGDCTAQCDIWVQGFF